MKIQARTNEMLNRLLQALFNGNALIDNLVYNLQYKGYDNLVNAIHDPVAHQMGAWADEISDLINELNGRSVRYGLEDHVEEVDVKGVFVELNRYFDNLRNTVCGMIDELDMSEDVEVRVFLEDFLNRHIRKYAKQMEEWKAASERLDENTLNIHIEDYTHYIS